MKAHYQFVLFVFGALLLSTIPVLHWPFSWMETYFHEISHGLAAILSGGAIERIELNFNGSGVCYTRGGWQFLVTFSGYFGAVVWGAVIFLLATASRAISRWLVLLLLSLLIMSAVFYARDLITIIIMSIIGFFLYTSFRFAKGKIVQRVMQFSGVYVMVSAARAPLDLIDGRNFGDGAALASASGLPEIVWALIWCAIAVATIVFVWNKLRNSV